MMWILVFVFALLSIVFLMGKGGFLIAGYNTASEEEKAQYDEKKLCRVMGIGMTVITISLIIASLYDEKAAVIMIGGIVVGMIIILMGTNIFCKNKDIKGVPAVTNVNKIRKWISWGITCVVGIIVLIVLFTGDVTVVMKGDSLTAKAFLTASTTVNVTDIESVKYYKNLDVGSREMGTGTFKITAGSFKNDELGDYQLYSYTNCKEYIVLTTKDGYIVVNDSDAKKTEQLYSKIQEKVKEHS